MTRHEYCLWGAKATAKRGTELPHVKLCEERAKQIRANPEGLTARQLAQQFGVHYRTIEKIRHFETWAHV